MNFLATDQIVTSGRDIQLWASGAILHHQKLCISTQNAVAVSAPAFKQQSPGILGHILPFNLQIKENIKGLLEPIQRRSRPLVNEFWMIVIHPVGGVVSLFMYWWTIQQAPSRKELHPGARREPPGKGLEDPKTFTQTLNLAIQKDPSTGKRKQTQISFPPAGIKISFSQMNGQMTPAPKGQ